MLEREIVLPADVDAVWRALTDEEMVAGWMGTSVEWELVPGAPARFHEHDGNRRDGRMELVEPGRRLRFRWWPVRPPGSVGSPSSGASAGSEASPGSEPSRGDAGASQGGSGDADGPSSDEPSEVTYELTPLPEGTRLRVTERPLSEPRAQASLQGFGWSNWDSRLAGCWVHVVGQSARVGARIRV